MLFAVTDIETTGGSPSGNSITEIAIVITDGKEIIEEYCTFINPQKRIPHYITVLTGITDEMLEDAPLFEEVADEIYELFKDKIFVAHNVNFDYSFIKAAFERCGKPFNQSKLCTVRYSRKMFPGLASYSLGALSTHFGLGNNNPHRAMNDTRMALELLCKALKKDEDKKELDTFLKRGKGDAFLPMNLNKESYFNLPEGSGVYYFRDSTGKIIYVGKAKNLKKRVRQHFSGSLKSAQKQAFFKEIFEIDFLLTGSELIASLKEDREIKHLWPKYNRAQKNPKRKFGVFLYEDRENRKRLAVQNMNAVMNPVKSFSSAFKARQWLYDFGELYNIPNYRLGLPEVDEPEAEKSPRKINNRLIKALDDIISKKETFIIKGKGRELEEVSIVLVRENEYAGFGFISHDEEIHTLEQLESVVEYSSHSDYSISLISQFIEKGNAGEVLFFENLKPKKTR